MAFLKTKKITVVPYQNMIRFVLLLTGLVFCSTFCFYLINLLLIFPWSAPQLITADKPEHVDLLVFLGGGSGCERIDYAVQLLKQEYSKILYTPHLMKNKEREYLSGKLSELDLPIHFYSGAVIDSTYNEALQTKKFVKEQGMESIILVTSPYHSLRASWIFRKVMPQIKIISAPCCLEADSLHKKLKSYLESEQYKFLIYYLLYAWRSYSFN
ncbi:MAG: YdcF family protein [Spirochaetales bacterium]|nr:YdcF family protein [Spirochaetales bacterium]